MRKIKTRSTNFEILNKFKIRISKGLKYLNFRFLSLFRISNFEFRISPRAGFTLIEALTTIVIIGILASLTIFSYASISARSRDTRRKSDLTTISLGFQSRYDAKACSDSADRGYYPGRSLGWESTTRWQPVSVLKSYTDGCGSFSEYLSVIPTDPRESGGWLTYRFDLSNQSGVIGKHYRLTTKLEKKLNPNESAYLAQAKKTWNNSFGGPLPPEYNYIIGN